ncbi:hypothetical protein T440DRAFT_60455 [Plenodomus tracheiphilus IPT5]|uniref:Uncharacterized protein n=1 Tax=Plenodomus tracheiphilus IPT5 TaxID=1408161 RepID=A0A6A7ALS5_9PLEO|nr:hypothetical protein T440DRAFT_60455 [Plenodomus tracheiphilus IPT5]
MFLQDLASTFLMRPLPMLLHTICLLISIYASFAYKILYASLLSLALEHQELRQLQPVVAALLFLALSCGCVLAGSINLLNNSHYFRRLFITYGYRGVPEARLPPLTLGRFALTAGLSLLGWTSTEHVASSRPSIIGEFLIGIGFTTMFESLLQYLVDAFTRYSASAIAANTFLRSMLAGALPLFIRSTYKKVGVDWGSIVFGCSSYSSAIFLVQVG